MVKFQNLWLNSELFFKKIVKYNTYFKYIEAFAQENAILYVKWMTLQTIYIKIFLA